MNHVITLALILAGSTVAAQTTAVDLELYKVNQVTYCSDNGPAMKREYLKSFQEVPLFLGDTTVPTIDWEDGNESVVRLAGELSMVVNQFSGSYTVFVTYPWGTVCEVLSGVNFEPYTGER
jgi:hypothetical protein